jgi:hypothetical protein
MDGAMTTRQSMVRLDRFIQATRDSGYKSTSNAIAEVVDNAVEAQATRVVITVDDAGTSAESSLRVAVADNGVGMASGVLAEALRFGGSSRFDHRGGLGRFGMGLPNASLSQAKRLDVYTWQDDQKPLWSYLDVDAIAAGTVKCVPRPKLRTLPTWPLQAPSPSGTLVVWDHCDRLDNRRVSTITKKLAVSLGRIFRYFLWDGVVIELNGVPVKPIDPLFLANDSITTGAQPFQEPWTCEVMAEPGAATPRVGTVQVSFSELPVHEWHHLSNQEKRHLGVADGAGMSIVRAGREVDYGWFFTGLKRRENYDDWWRCEVRFDPVLDEAFGVTHTKQQIRPKPHLVDALEGHIEPIVRALNSRVRKTYQRVTSAQASLGIESKASRVDHSLLPIPKRQDPAHARFLTVLARHDSVLSAMLDGTNNGTRYRIVEEETTDHGFFAPAIQEHLVAAVVNPKHPFYQKLYRPLIERQSSKGGEDLGNAIQALLLAAARAEGLASKAAERRILNKFRQEWSSTLATLLR